MENRMKGNFYFGFLLLAAWSMTMTSCNKDKGVPNSSWLSLREITQP